MDPFSIIIYNFQSFGEYRTLLEMFHVTAEEVKGEYKDRAYQGLVYSATDENGAKIGVLIKSSKLGKSVGYEALQKKFEKSKIDIDNLALQDRLKPIISTTLNKSKSLDDFKQSLLQQGIGCITRQNADARIYGISFIDYQNRTILNGSRLGKEFSANIFNDLFQKPPKEMSPRVIQSESIKPNQTIDYQQNFEPTSLGLFEQHATDWESEQFAREKEQEEKARQRKRRFRRL